MRILIEVAFFFEQFNRSADARFGILQTFRNISSPHSPVCAAAAKWFPNNFLLILVIS